MLLIRSPRSCEVLLRITFPIHFWIFEYEPSGRRKEILDKTDEFIGVNVMFLHRMRSREANPVADELLKTGFESFPYQRTYRRHLWDLQPRRVIQAFLHNCKQVYHIIGIYYPTGTRAFIHHLNLPLRGGDNVATLDWYNTAHEHQRGVLGNFRNEIKSRGIDEVLNPCLIVTATVTANPSKLLTARGETEPLTVNPSG
jgi:hypothetical protein